MESVWILTISFLYVVHNKRLKIQMWLIIILASTPPQASLFLLLFALPCCVFEVLIYEWSHPTQVPGGLW